MNTIHVSESGIDADERIRKLLISTPGAICHSPERQAEKFDPVP